MSQHLGNRNSQHSFAKTPSINMARSSFNRSFARKDTMDFDILYPFFIDEVLPGDTINLSVKLFGRLATQAVPFMDNAYLDFFFFYEPSRVLQTNFVKLMGEQTDPEDSIDYLIPQVQYSSLKAQVGTIFDKMGLPTDWATLNDISVNALPFRMYNDIINNWFRDQNLQSSLFVPRDDGPDNPNDYNLFRTNKKHDYFTSATRSPQKGNPVTIPMGGMAPVTGSIGGPNSDYRTFFTNHPNGGNVSLHNGGSTGTSAAVLFNSTNSLPSGLSGEIRPYIPSGGLNGQLWHNLTADLGAASSLAITQFRTAMQMQSFLERDNRGGTRYKELIMSHFNVVVPDYRVQIPETLSASTIMINQHVIAQTSESGATPQANLASFSTVSENSSKVGFSKSFTEHGYVMGLVRARADVTYQQNVNRMWTRKTRYDFFWSEFQELGDQAIRNDELFFFGDALDLQAFGYNERYGDYRYRPSEICGQFRSNYAETLDAWHLAQKLGPSRPALNSAFIQSQTPIERNLVMTEGYPALLMDYWFDYNHVRPMVAYPSPSALGRF